MMFLLNAIRAEVEPVPKRKGWYQLTGEDIVRVSMPVADMVSELEDFGVKVDRKAKVLGIHNVEPEIGEEDPRFNEENVDEETSFCVYKDADSGKRYMLLAVNQPEYAILRFLLPHEEGAEFDDDLELYRSGEKKTASMT